MNSDSESSEIGFAIEEEKVNNIFDDCSQSDAANDVDLFVESAMGDLDSLEIGRWEVVNPPIEVHINKVQQDLFEKLRSESLLYNQRFLDKLRRKYPQIKASQVRTKHHAMIWLEKIAELLLKKANKHCSVEDRIGPESIVGFMADEFMMASYKTSPDDYFDVENPDRFKKPKMGLQPFMYKEVLRRLSIQESNAQHIAGDEEFTGAAMRNYWKPPMSLSPDIMEAQEELRRFNCSLAFFESKTIISMDDNQLRLRSKKSEEQIGVSRVRNPKKTFGPVEHGLVNLLLGFFLGGHVGMAGEGTVDAVKLLYRSLLPNKYLESQLLGAITNLTTLDRGYLYEEVLRTIVQYGGGTIGTLKRCYFSPFTYGTCKKFPHQKSLDEKGPKYSLFARQVLVKDAKNKDVFSYAGIHRNGTGSCFMTHTTSLEFGPGKWEYVIRSSSRTDTCQGLSNSFADLLEQIVLLTQTQRTPDWFLLRTFRFTSTAAAAIFRSLSQSRHVEDMDLNYFLSLFGIGNNMQQQLLNMDLEVEEPLDFSHETIASLRARYNHAQLKEFCRQRNLRVSGNKSTLATRLILPENVSDYDDTNGEGDTAPVDRLLRDVMKTWFMKPVKTVSLKLGSLNETFILPKVPEFFNAYSELIARQGQKLIWKEQREFGLTHLQGSPFIATSVDAVGILEIQQIDIAADLNVDFDSVQIFVPIELKTMTTQNTRDVAVRHSNMPSVGKLAFCDSTDITRFHLLVTDVSHRAQIFHHAVSMQTQHCLYVISSLGTIGIIRMVLVEFNADIQRRYIDIFRNIAETQLQWVYGNAPLPNLASHALGYCGSVEVLQQYLALWKSLSHKIIENNSPYPPAKQILPTVIAMWNSTKGGIDRRTRMGKNVKVDHAQLQPETAIWLCKLNDSAYNTFHSERNWASAQLLSSGQVTEFSKYQNLASKKIGPFKKYLYKLAQALDMAMFPYLHVQLQADVDGDSSCKEEEQHKTPENISVIASKTAVYKRVKKLLANSTLNAKRLADPDKHKPVLIDPREASKDGRLCCEICCSKCAFADGVLVERNKAHHRSGNRTRYCCSECNVVLCTTGNHFLFKGTSLSCFQIFHSESAEVVHEFMKNLCKIPNPKVQGFVTHSRSARREEQVTSKRARYSIEIWRKKQDHEQQIDTEPQPRIQRIKKPPLALPKSPEK